MLAPVLDPAHRVADLQRQRRDRDVLGHDAVLAAEAAADVGGDDTDLVLGQAQRLRHADPHHVSALGGEIDDELVVAVIPVGQDAAALERHGGMPVHAKLPAQADRRAGERSGLAFGHDAGDVGVVRPGLEHPRAAGLHRRYAIDHGGKLGHLDLHLVGEVLGLRPRQRNAHGDRLADVTHDTVGERGIRTVAMGGQFRSGLENFERPQIRQCKDISGGGRLHHPQDLGMRAVAADEGHVLHPRHAEIGNELAVAEQMAGVLLAQQARSDPTLGGQVNGHIWLLFPWCPLGFWSRRNLPCVRWRHKRSKSLESGHFQGLGTHSGKS